MPFPDMAMLTDFGVLHVDTMVMMYPAGGSSERISVKNQQRNSPFITALKTIELGYVGSPRTRS